jgi:cardiolipin synthase
MHPARGVRHVQPAGGEIIQEEQRLGTLHHQIVHAHRHQIDADMVMQPGLDRQHQLGAHAVGGRHQHRVGEACRLQVEQRAKPAQAAHHAWPVRGFRKRLDPVHQGVSRLDIDTRILVAGHGSGPFSVARSGSAAPSQVGAFPRRLDRLVCGMVQTGPVTPQDPAARSALLNLPNAISFARLCAVPVAIYLVIEEAWLAAFALFAAAGVSDAIDGWLARRQGGTALGAALDPLADKALMVGMYVTLAAIRQLPVWLAILVVFRDVMIVGGLLLLWLYDHPMAIKPLSVSKVNTGLQIGLVGLVLGLNAAGLDLPVLRLAGIWLIAISTVASFAAYVHQVVRPA